MNVLVGYTGFVGSNIYSKGKFDKVFNSKNIRDAYGLRPDLLVYAGLRAEKYLANNFPDRDMELILEAEKNISEIQPKKLVLISTVDVFDKPLGVDENTEINTRNLHAYGLNRYRLEEWVRENYKNSVIIRLPALFGMNIKKNFIYDYIKRIPFMLKSEKYLELVTKESDLEKYYCLKENGFYQCKELSKDEERKLKIIFEKVGFSALNFTDSRNSYQFYPLSRLWSDIEILLDNDIRLWHPATEPVSAGELYEYLEGKNFENELKSEIVKYDFKTIHCNVFGGEDGYILSKKAVLGEIKKFVHEYSGC